MQKVEIYLQEGLNSGKSYMIIKLRGYRCQYVEEELLQGEVCHVLLVTC